MTIQQDIQQPVLEPLISLFLLDAIDIGGGTYRFVPMSKDYGSITWQGEVYTPVPIMVEGFEWSNTGAPPKPTLTISNVSKFLQGAVSLYGDLVGATIIRYRTFKKFLDGEPSADPNAYLPLDKYIVEQKVVHNREIIQWKLSSIIDQEGLKLPRRQVLRDRGYPGVGLVKVR